MASKWMPVTEADYRYVEYMKTIYPGWRGDLQIQPLGELISPKLQTARRKKAKRSGKHRMPAALRIAVKERDGNRCAVCGCKNKLQIHHKKHRKHGGTDDMDNLITLCAICHANEHMDEPVFNIMGRTLL